MNGAADRDVAIKTMCPAVDVRQAIACRQLATCHFLILCVVECVNTVNVTNGADWTEHYTADMIHCSNVLTDFSFKCMDSKSLLNKLSLTSVRGTEDN